MELLPHRRVLPFRRVASGVLPVALALVVVACDATLVPSPTSASSVGPGPAMSVAVASPPPSPGRSPYAPTPVASVPTPAAPATTQPAAEASPAAPAVSVPEPCPGATATGKIGPADRSSSTNWSGIAAIASQSVIGCVEATWIQPTVRCSASSLQAVSIWVGIGGFDQTPLEQIGTEVDCRRGKATSSMWRESLPRERYEVPLGLTIRSGDHIRARVLALGRSRYELSIANLTRHTSYAVRDTNRGLRATSAEWIVEAPTGGCPSRCHILPLPNFGQFRFSGTWATVSGTRQPLNGAGATHVQIAMEDDTGKARASVRSLGAAGTSFVVAWRKA